MMVGVYYDQYPGYDDQGTYDVEKGYVLAENQGAPHHAPDNGYSLV